YLRALDEYDGISNKELSDLIARSAIWIFVKNSECGVEMDCSLIKRINIQAFASGHRKKGEGFIRTVAPTVMMGKDLGYFGQAVAAAALDFLGDLQMQCSPRFAEQTLVQRVAHQRVFERIIA